MNINLLCLLMENSGQVAFSGTDFGETLGLQRRLCGQQYTDGLHPQVAYQN